MAVTSVPLRISALDDLISLEQKVVYPLLQVEDLYGLDAVAKKKWQGRTVLELWQLVALHSGIDPDSIGVTAEDAIGRIENAIVLNAVEERKPSLQPPDRFDFWLSTYLDACAWIESGELATVMDDVSPAFSSVRRREGAAKVKMRDFLATANLRSLPVAGPWRQRDPNNGRWPWGSHETALLAALAKVGELWRRKEDGGPFDVNDLARAPKQAVMFSAFEEVGVKEDYLKKALSKLLKADEVPAGPRTNRRRER